MPRCVCPACRQTFDSDASPAMPFCSQRCRMIDLGRWFEEENVLPVERDHELDAFKNPTQEPGED